ncbi:MFS transporter [Kocuria sp. SM24M-10]|uniref:MFS transporter n=1 Tax=Kocuria sp. SM24M-10 TaxID=1660349 RepID=UPI00064B0C30|nr:MFS transporter [Kocuria sp. SM24M-10]KLU08187.1 MFS transporter [Kocuria sp. SM24M-10]
MPLPRALEPFRLGEYRVLAFAMFVSVFGAGMWAVALVNQVLELDGTAVDLSAVTAVGALGMLVVVLVGGIAADRLPLAALLRLVETANALTAATVAVLALTGGLRLWHLGAAAFVFGAGVGFFYPAYSAALPRVLPARQLLAANGVEGTARPLLQQAAGPAVAGVLIGLLAPGGAVALIAACHLAALVLLLRLHVPEREALPVTGPAARAPLADPAVASAAEPVVASGAESAAEPVVGSAPDAQASAGAAEPSGGVFASVRRDLMEGVRYTVHTPWLLWTLLWAVCAVFLLLGPLEVLVPFLVRDRLGGDAATFGYLLACYGGASALASLVVASLPLPRRYLSWMIGLWGLGTLPFGLVATTESFWVMALCLACVGAGDGAGMVLWGTLLQRRVPRHMLGRVSSLDFFVSIALMPVSMAIAGPVAQVVPLPVIFWTVAVLTPVLGFVALWAGRMRQDELAHPLAG